MLFRRKPFDYPLMDPPFPVIPLRQMSKEEAMREFEWFVTQSESRRNLLIAAVKATAGPANALDYSPQSLVPLWRHMAQFMEERPPTAAEMKKYNERQLHLIEMLGVKVSEFTTGTGCLVIDIGFYIAEVFMRRYPKVKWMLWTKKIGPYNKPVLSGFKLPLVPSDLAGGSAWKKIRGNDKETSLLEGYEVWAKDLEEKPN